MWVSTPNTIGDRVGWRVKSKWLSYDELKFNTTALAGHLPGVGCVGCVVGCVWWVEGVDALFSRVETCRL